MRVFVIGIGQTQFLKPGRSGRDYPDLVGEAVHKALDDASLRYSDMQVAAAGYIYGSSCCAQRALYDIGMTGIPIFNVNNACASGSSAMLLCKHLLAGGAYDVALAVGFEKMARGSLENMAQFTDRANPAEKHIGVMSETYGLEPAPITAQMFGMAGREHMEKYGTKREHFAKIAYKNHKHSVNNPDAQFQKEYTMDEILNSRPIYNFMTMLECSPTSDGSAAVVMCTERWLRAHPELQGQAVEVLGMQLATDLPSAFEANSNIHMVGFDAARLAAERLYKETQLGIDDVQAIELHDCFAPNELLTYEALGMCPIGQGGRLVDSADTTYGGKWVVNPSGGLIAKGHPIGATGVSQCVELCKQLRGTAGKRQVPHCRVALQHNIGIGGACFLAMYRLAQMGTAAGAGNSVPPQVAHSGPAFESDRYFALIAERAKQEGAALAAKVNSSFQMVIEDAKGAVKKWLVDIRPGKVFVGQKEAPADVEIRMSDGVFVSLATGKIKGEQAFMQGKMKVKGNMTKVLKLRDVVGAQTLPAKL